MNACRCGYTGPEEGHPCHFNGYLCGKPAKQRFYNARPVALAGMILKFETTDTWACDEHWESWRKEHRL